MTSAIAATATTAHGSNGPRPAHGRRLKMALCERCGEEIALANGCDPYRPHHRDGHRAAQISANASQTGAEAHRRPSPHAVAGRCLPPGRDRDRSRGTEGSNPSSSSGELDEPRRPSRIFARYTNQERAVLVAFRNPNVWFDNVERVAAAPVRDRYIAAPDSSALSSSRAGFAEHMTSANAARRRKFFVFSSSMNHYHV